MNAITILITDDHALLRQSLVQLFNSDKRFRVIAESGSGEEAEVMVRRLRPDIVVLDINLPGMNGFDTCKKILGHSPATKILGVSMNAEYIYASKMIQCGGMGYVTKNSAAPELFKAVIEIFNNRKYICSDIKNQLSASLLEPVIPHVEKKSLTAREVEIIGHIKKGLTSKKIAILLDLSVKTIESHRFNILKKLKLRNVAALVNYSGNLF